MKEYYETQKGLFARLEAYLKGEAPLSDPDRNWFIRHAAGMVDYYQKDLQKLADEEEFAAWQASRKAAS